MVKEITIVPSIKYLLKNILPAKNSKNDSHHINKPLIK